MIDRLDALRKLLENGELTTQEELRTKLEREGYEVTQSTVSRDLRKLGAVRALDAAGRTVYRLSPELEPALSSNLSGMVKSVDDNGMMIVIHTVVGSASLVARHLDRVRPEEILGTIAGDDTIFVAPASATPRGVKAAVKAVMQSLEAP